MYLDDMGYDTSKDIYSNYDTAAKRDEKEAFFMSFYEKGYENLKQLINGLGKEMG